MTKFDRDTALSILNDLSKNMRPDCDLFGNKTLVIHRYMFEEIRKKYLDATTIPTFMIGDIIWVYDIMWGIIPCKIDKPYHCICGKKPGCTFEMCFEEDDIGKYVFDTKEAAEEVWRKL